ncbi:MAG: DUF1330 domain-containing protein [Chthoniobacterales bacterium]
MSAYIIVEIEIIDPAGYEEYKKLAGATVEKYGGEYIVRGGDPENMEGDWRPKRIVVLKFADRDRAKAWLNSAEYAEPRKRRHATATSRMIVVGGT